MQKWGWKARCAAALSVLALCSLSNPAVAGKKADRQRAAAKILANRAFKLMTEGRHADAVAVFKRANDTYHSPVFVLYMADAEEKRGRLAAARQLLADLIAEGIPEEAPKAFRVAKKKAERRLAELETRVPRVALSIEGAADPVVELDGRDVSKTAASGVLWVDPGEHVIDARAGGVVERQRVKVSIGDHIEVSFDLTPEKKPDDKKPAPVAPSSSAWIPPTIAFTVAGAGLIFGGVTGGLFLSKESALRDACRADDGDDTTCPPALGGDLDDTKLFGTMSTVGFVVAGVGVVTGTVLLLTLGGDDDDGEEASQVTLQLHAGPTSLGLFGRF